MSTTATESKPTSQVRVHGLFQMLTDRGWWVGTELQCLTQNPTRFDPKRKQQSEPEYDRIRLVRVETWNGQRVNRDGTFDVSRDDPRFGRPANVRSGIITFVEYPTGGSVTAFSLNCRDWREAK